MVANHVPQHEQFARAFSRLCGWIYFLCWSASFYPQPILNWHRKATTGTAIDFPTLNVLGFACYTTSTAVFLASPKIRRQYAARNPRAPEPTVQPNDLAYAAHALLLAIIIYSQYWPVGWGFKTAKDQRASWGALVVLWGSIIAIFVCIAITASKPSRGEDPGQLAWIDVISAIGYVKVLITAVKYMPQAWLNFKRKSTIGWSIGQILLDFAGGVLSLLQLVVDASLQGNWSDATSNPIKLYLGNITIFFDLIFIIQHFVLYRRKSEQGDDVVRSGRASSEEPLLEAPS